MAPLSRLQSVTEVCLAWTCNFDHNFKPRFDRFSFRFTDGVRFDMVSSMFTIEMC